jgi:pilus assembly protein CpaC
MSASIQRIVFRLPKPPAPAAQTSSPACLARPGLAGLTLALTLAAAGQHCVAFAQTLEQAEAAELAAAERNNPAAKAEKEAARNNISTPLRPKVKRTPATPQGLYAPVQKQDDAGQVPEIELFVGESRVFPAPGVARIAVGNGQIMTASALDDKEVIIFGNGVGTSSLFIWHEDGRYQRIKVNIVPGDTSRIAREVAAFLTRIPHAQASIVGDKVIVEGDELSDADREKVAELAKRYPQIVNFTSPIGWEQTVLMDVKVVEFPKNELRELGLRWSPTGGAGIGAIWSPLTRGNMADKQINLSSSGTLPITNIDPSKPVPLPSGLAMTSAINLGLNAELLALEQNGTASVLAEPQLSTRSGYKSSFLAGGEFPYSVSSLTGVTIQFKPYGIKLEIEPRVGRNGVVRAVIEAEVSSLDSSITSTAAPALLTRRTKTEFNVRGGETIVLSGLLQRNSSNDIDKVPLLGDIPVLGALFRSKRFQNKETELVVFVTPTVVDSRSPGLVDRIERTGERLGERLGKPPYLSDPLQPGADAAKVNQPPGRAVPPAPADAPAVQPAPAGLSSPASAPPQASAPVQPGGSSLRVKVDGLVVRAQPDAGSAALLELGYNSVVRLGPADPAPPGRGLWRNVTVGEITGWVRADGVEPVSLSPRASKSTAGGIATRDQASRMPGLAAAQAPAAAATPASAAPLLVTAQPPQAGASASAGRQRYRVGLAALALLASPDTNAAVIGRLAEGQLVEALPQAPRGNWIAVQSGAERGWVASQWLQAVSSIPANN